MSLYRPHVRPYRGARLSAKGVVIVAALLLPTAGLAGQRPFPTDARTQADTTRSPAYPAFDLERELTFVGLGVDLVVAGNLVPPAVRPLPSSGLDRSDLLFDFDRSAVGAYDRNAALASDVTRDAALMLPLVAAFATASGGRLRSAVRSAAVYAEALMISGGLTQLGKRTLGRPRPTAYLAEPDRPAGFEAERLAPGTFHSMPSGHSSAAWTGASMAITDYLLRRPNAHWGERLAIGLIGGGLASATSALRVKAGVHFPTDVVAGAGLGMLVGVVVPLSHRGATPAPAPDAWLQAFGGTLAGAALGLSLAGAF